LFKIKLIRGVTCFPPTHSKADGLVSARFCMKNIVIVDIDTDRKEQPLILGKQQDFVLPENVDDKNELIFNDIKTLTEGLASLIRHADLNGIHKKDVLIDAVIKHLNLDPNSDK